MKMRNILFIGMAGLLSACGTVNYLEIETYNPAEVTFPKSVEKILVVNNAVPQPEDVGYECQMLGHRQDTCKAKADSVLFDACRSLGESMVDASYFKDVLLYHDALRKDQDAASDLKLTREQVDSLCMDTGADAVISVDRLLFDMKRDVQNIGNGFVLGVIDVKFSGVVRSYMPGRELPMTTIYVKDSIYWAESADFVPVLEKIMPTPEAALRGAAGYFGLLVHSNFVPHWNKERRWYYTGIGARWKEASAYVTKERWTLAEQRWRHIYDRTKGTDTRAKAASNIALCREMKGDFKSAFEWAHKSYDLFKSKDGGKSKNTEMLEGYLQALAQRIRSDKKLSAQFASD